MSHVEIALIVFVCVFGSALLGLYVRTLLPEHHLSDESTNVLKLAVGLIATMAAIVLGLLISSAKNSFDTVNGELVRNAANIVVLDRVLAKYGPETKDVRDLLKQRVGTVIQILASGKSAEIARLRGPEAIGRAESLEHKLEELSPRNDAQRQLQARAIQIADDVLAARQLTMLQAVGSTPAPLLICLVLWLSIIFCSFGLFAPANATVIFGLLLGALSTSVAIFLILEMNTPLDGVISVSLAPMREALAMLGQ
ncbi:bestrophin-like domain [Burkholderia sp. MR1-5-21]